MNISSEFIWRRLHSLMGLWLVLYLSYHLLVNSQAALWLGQNGSGFIRMVNSLESLPYLHLIEILFIGVPFLVHGIWGIKRALQSKINSLPTNNASPALVRYGRNHAFTWQRITSWILLIGVIGHVIQMRFIDQPSLGQTGKYQIVVTKDDRLPNLAEQIGATITPNSENTVLVTASSPGAGMLFMVRNIFKSFLMCILYTIFVFSAAFHAFNGLWTALLTWGMILSYKSQKAMLPVGWIGATLLSLLGLAAIWGSYWL